MRKTPFAAATLLVATLGACTPPDPNPEPGAAVIGRPAEVRILELNPRIWRRDIAVYGVLEAAEEVEVGIDFNGVVGRVLFHEGRRVGQGEVLLELDSRKRGWYLERARSMVQSAAAALEDARSTLKRRQRLAVKKLVSGEDLDRARVAVRKAAAAHDDALAASRLAERELEEVLVRSPVAGIVELREVEPGETVLPGRVLAVIQAVDMVRVVVFVSEKDVNDLSVETPARLVSPGVRGRVFEARVESVGVKANPATGNFPVKLIVRNEEGLLRPGMSARVQLPGLERHDLLLVPDRAVVDRDRRRVVFLERDGRAVEREPVLRISSGDWLPVLDGLVSGDRLIVSGLDYVVDGTPVRVLPETPE